MLEKTTRFYRNLRYGGMLDAHHDDCFSDPIGRQPDTLIDELHAVRRAHQATIALAQATIEAVDVALRSVLLARDAAVRAAHS